MKQRAKMLGAIVGTGLALGLVALPPAKADGDLAMQSTSDASFEDVALNLEDAIVNRGYSIDYHGFIGDMLKRTGSDVGDDTTLYNDAQFFTFCSAVISRNAMVADRSNILYCPYSVMVWEDAASPGTVQIGYRRLPAGEGRDEVNALLDEIIAEAIAAK